MGRGHRLHPDRLPDARRALVEDAAVGHGALFADRLPRGVGAVGDAHDDLLLAAWRQRVGHVGGEGAVPAGVRGDLLPVDVDRGLVVDGAEVQGEPVVLADPPLRRHLERPAIPHVVLVALDAGQRRLGGVRHEDAFRQGLPEGRSLPLRGPGELPDAVQVAPLGAGQLRPGILRQRVLGRHVVRPRSHEPGLARGPVHIGFRRGHRGERTGEQQRGHRGEHGSPTEPAATGSGRWCGWQHRTPSSQGTASASPPTQGTPVRFPRMISGSEAFHTQGIEVSTRPTRFQQCGPSWPHRRPDTLRGRRNRRTGDGHHGRPSRTHTPW